MTKFGPGPVQNTKDLLAVHKAMVEWISRSFGIPASYFKEDKMEPKEKFEVVDIYNDPDADTVIYYDTDGDQHVEVKDGKTGS